MNQKLLALLATSAINCLVPPCGVLVVRLSRSSLFHAEFIQNHKQLPCYKPIIKV